MRIGQEYEVAFKSAIAIINSGLIDDIVAENGINVVGGTIIHNGKEYRLEESEIAQQRQQHDYQTTPFTQDGAFWFESVRNPNNENENAAWISFLELIASAYHKKYAISIKKSDTEPELDSKKEAKINEFITKFTETFFSLSGNSFIISKKGTNGNGIKKEKVYGISLRLDISGANSPEPRPILCKVYFSDNGEKIVPLLKDKAEKINNIPIRNSGQVGNEGGDASAIIKRSLGALNDLIENKGGEYRDFGDYMCYGEEDDRVIRAINNRGAHDNDIIYCRRVKVLGIINVETYSYHVMFSQGKTPIFDMLISEDLNDIISLKCANCGDETFVTNNCIEYKVNNKNRRVEIKLDESNFGLDTKTIKEIKESKAFKEHLIQAKCTIMRNNAQNCQRLICATQGFNKEVKGKLEWRCKDCDYPEKVYTDKEGKQHFTEDLAYVCYYADDKRELIPKEDTIACEWCGRSFDKRTHHEKLCEVCATANNLSKNRATNEEKRPYKDAYKENAYMFHPLWRIANMFNEKYCVDKGDEIMVFVVNSRIRKGTSHKYIFKKLSAVGEYGLIKGPQKLDSKK